MYKSCYVRANCRGRGFWHGTLVPEWSYWWRCLPVAYYRQQRSCGRVMFLHLSVSHSVHRGASGRHPPGRNHPPPCWVENPPRAENSLGQTPPFWSDTPQAGTSWADMPPANTSPWADPRQTPSSMATAADGTHPTGMLSCWHKIFYCSASGVFTVPHISFAVVSAKIWPGEIKIILSNTP